MTQANKATFARMLDDGYAMLSDTSHSRLDYLSDFIFDFTTYDSDMSELFAAKAIEVCRAISDRTTREYIEKPENYCWFLLMCNMPFFKDRISWGTSIVGAWWSVMSNGEDREFRSTGLYIGKDQVATPLIFDDEGWLQFIAAIIEFAASDPPQPCA